MTKVSVPIRMGVLGCGPIAQNAHFESCRKADNAMLYAICDSAPDLVERMASIHEPQRSYLDYDDMLADEKVDAVIIATADAFHVPLALRALQAGKHVLLEKPLGLDIAECLQLENAVEESGCVLQVGHMKRYDPGIEFAKRFIDEEMGGMLALKAWYCDSTYRYTMTDNLLPVAVTSSQRRVPEENPKETDRRRYYMLTHGSHLIDTARFLGGEIVMVQARLAEKFGAHCWFVSADFADGSVGHLDLTVAVRMDWHEGFQIYGEKGSIVGKTYLPWYLKSSDVECFATETGQYHRLLGADAHFYRRQVEAFARCIVQGTVPNPHVGDGVAAMRIMAAINRSVETGRPQRPQEISEGRV